MNKKGQMDNVGMVIGIFIAIVVVTSLLSGAIYGNIGSMTRTLDVKNETVTFGSVTLLQGKSVSNVVVSNVTNTGQVITAGNYTIVNENLANGVLRAYLVNTTAVTPNPTVNVSYTYEPLTYADDGGSRAIINLIAIFSAVAVIVVVVWKIKESGGLDVFG